jgi:hypothetical protein
MPNGLQLVLGSTLAGLLRPADVLFWIRTLLTPQKGVVHQVAVGTIQLRDFGDVRKPRLPHLRDSCAEFKPRSINELPRNASSAQKVPDPR